jgi:photosystem II stability/assembly factor-like uncharacterized protein
MSGQKRGLMLVSSGYIWPQAVGGVAPLRLWQTSNGGQTWTELRTVPRPFPQTLGTASFTAADGAWVGWLTTDGGLERTTDTGRTWRSLPDTPHMDEIDFTTPSLGVGWSGPRNGRILLWLSSDAGHHWIRVPLPTAVANDTNTALLPVNASFSNSRVGWLLADGTAWRTINAGHAWHRSGPSAFDG